MDDLNKFLDTTLIKLKNFELTGFDLGLILVTFLLTWLLIWFVKLFLSRARVKQKLDKGQRFATFRIAKYLLIVIAIAIALESMGIKITILLAGSAALLVGIGLGLQNIFNDLVSGFVLLFGGSVQVEDVVEVDGVVGRVKTIGLRTSEIQTLDNIIMIIPNSKFVSENVINWSHNELLTRFSVSIGVAYGSDPQQVKKILLDCADQHNEVKKHPAPFVRFNDFGDSALLFELCFWTERIMPIKDIQSDLRYIIAKQFKEHSIIIPFPQRDLHIKSSVPLQ